VTTGVRVALVLEIPVMVQLVMVPALVSVG